MKRPVVLTLSIGLACVLAPAFAQEHGTGPLAKEESFAEKHELELKIANFVILAGLIGWFIGKNAGPFYAARSVSIRRDLDESRRQNEDAQARAAEVERRLAHLEADIAALRAESELEIKAETERLSRRTAEEMAKIQAHAEQEIASASKAARMELKRYSAELAVSLAEEKIRARMTPVVEDTLVQGFVKNLK
jgi:F-type H+-transporting ATPase subunit b